MSIFDIEVSGNSLGLIPAILLTGVVSAIIMLFLFLFYAECEDDNITPTKAIIIVSAVILCSFGIVGIWTTNRNPEYTVKFDAQLSSDLSLTEFAKRYEIIDELNWPDAYRVKCRYKFKTEQAANDFVDYLKSGADPLDYGFAPDT